MKQNAQIGYSSVQKKQFVKKFSQILAQIEPLLIEKLDGVDIKQFQEDCIQYFREQIIPDLPYIGGNANPMSSYLILTSNAVALYHRLQAIGFDLVESAEVIYRGMMLVAADMPDFFARIYGWWLNSSIQYPMWRNAAQKSKQKVYPFDWVFSFVDGRGQPFDYGIDIRECGIIKYLEKEGCSELTPYLCSVDYITHAAMGVELRRTQALAFGCDRCDFRFKKNGQPLRPGWPPEFPEKSCGQ